MALNKSVRLKFINKSVNKNCCFCVLKIKNFLKVYILEFTKLEKMFK